MLWERERAIVSVRGKLPQKKRWSTVGGIGKKRVVDYLIEKMFLERIQSKYLYIFMTVSALIFLIDIVLAADLAGQ